MNHPINLAASFAIAAVVLSLAGAARAANVSFSAKAPALGPNDISNLKGASDEGNNVSDGDDDATYIADDRPIQGQTFKTGANASGYQLRAVTLREVKCETYALVSDLTYTIRVTKPSGTALEVIATERAEATAASEGNIPTIGDGSETGSGSGVFTTFTFDKPVALKPNTIYGFDIGGGTTRHYWQTDGTSSNVYADGAAYSSGTAGVGRGTRTSQTGDRVFVVALSSANAPNSNQAKASPEKTPNQ